MLTRALITIPSFAIVALSVLACDTYQVKLNAGDCVSASTAAVECTDARAVRRVVEVIRKEGAFASCAPPLIEATFTEGGDGPMIGVTVCMEPVAAPTPGVVPAGS